MNDPMKMKRQATYWEKKSANHVLDKVLISRIYKEPSQLKSKNIKLENGQKTSDISPKRIYK